MAGADNWNDLWQDTNLDFSQDKIIIDNEIHSVRWRRIEKEAAKRLGSLKGLNVIEVGSGRGEVSLIMALAGSKVTLVDNSPFALKRAAELFRHFDLSVEVIEADIFSLPGSLSGKYDISMSFGVVEHFLYPRRQEAIDIHYRLLKPRGVSFISVPANLCLAYWIFRVLAKASGHWKMGLEVPFSRRELLMCAQKANFKDCRVFGSSALRDTLYFLFLKPLFHIMKKETSAGLRHLELPAFLDDNFAAFITLAGEKS